MMTADVIQLDSRRPVWRIVRGYCRACRAHSVSAQPRDYPLDNAECLDCGAYAFCVTHHEVDGRFVPRPEALH